MAEIPTPRSYSEIVGEMVDALLSRLGLPSLRVGSPALSIIEAAAQSDLRSSQDIFNLLNSLSLDRASGLALDRIGADENVPRNGQSPASGLVDITDSSFAKIASRIYQGTGSPIVGSTTLNVEDASKFPTSGNVYIGRGTTNYEGPIAYSSKTNVGTYWSLNLSSGTTKFHNLGEGVVLAQGGSRTIASGTLLATPQGNAGTAVQFATTFSSTIPDGETQVLSVPVTARVPGTIGNVILNTITQFISSPFSGATVTNPSPFSNGLDTEDDQTYRERIRSVRQSRTKGTALAIETGVIGITALDENKRVLSASVVTRDDEPTTLYIDDGTGYEESNEGIAFEVIVDSALGGEQYFALANGRPVAKAFAETTLTTPFALVANSQLSVIVGGVRTSHPFSASDFRSISNASAFEIATSINSNPSLLWSARVSSSGTKVSIFAKADTNEDVQVTNPDTGFFDANLNLGFTANIVRTLWLYKNDILLTKDGTPATVITRPQSTWGAVTSGATLNISVDGIALVITINDVDFVNAGTTYVSTAASNSLAAWAQVFNFKIPGVTVTVDGDSLDFTSNRGRLDAASLAITGGTISAAMFSSLTAQGSTKDYTLDRNLGEIKLEVPLVVADRLTAGSFATRGFEQTPSFLTHTVASVATSVTGQNGAELWIVVDGASVIVPNGAGLGAALTITNPSSPVWGQRVRYNSNVAANLFGNVKIGDWLIATDLNFNINNRGAYRVAAVDAGGTWVEIERTPAWAFTQSAFTLSANGLTFVRTATEPQRVFVTAAANYTALSLVAIIQPQLVGATAEVYRTQQIRLRTNSFIGGDVAIVASNTEGLALGFPLGGAVTSGISHLASLTAGNPQAGTPNFLPYSVTAVTSSTVIDYGAGVAPSIGGILVGQRPLTDASGTKYNNKNHISALASRAGTVLTLRTPAVEQWLVQDRFYIASPYAISARDQLAVVIDGDEVSKRYVMNMYRKATPGSSTYGLSNDFHDADNGGSSLGIAFGAAFDWSDFAVHMKARGKANGIMWRYYRHGPEGNFARVQYVYPTSASQATSLVTVNTKADANVDIAISLRSGATRTGVSVRNSSFIGMATTAGPDINVLYTYLYVMYLAITTGQRQIQLNYTSRNSTAFAGVITGGTSGATGTVVSDSNAGGSPAASGFVVLTGVVGAFVPGETLTAGAASATSAGTQYGWTTLTLTLPATITDHGLAVNDSIWFQSTNINFSTGTYTVAARAATTISFVDIATTQGGTATPGRISKDPAGEVTLLGSTVVVGDLFSVAGGTNFPAVFTQTIKTLTLGNDSFTGQSPNVNGTSTTLSWFAVNNAALLSWYPVDAGSTLTNISADISAAANTPVTGFIYGTPSNTILAASYEAPGNGGIGNVSPWYPLVDGINFILSNTTPVLPAQVNFTFKNAIDATLATNSDWANEDVRLVPVTAKNVVNYLNSSGVGGLFEAAEIALSQQGQKPQITTVTAGDQGSVVVEGGSANSTTAAVVGSAVADTAGVGSSLSVLASEIDGLNGGDWVAITNTSVAPKSIITSATGLASIGTLGDVIITTTKAWKWSLDGGSTQNNNKLWQIEKQGKFVACTWADTGSPANFGNVQEGDWCFFFGFSGNMSQQNLGWFRVAQVDHSSNTFWIENPNAIEEITSCISFFFDYNSIIIGDTFVINTPLWGAANIGTWTVFGIDFTNQFRFFIQGSKAVTPQGAVAALGSSASLIQDYEFTPSRVIKKITSIAPNGSTLADLKFTTNLGIQNVGAAFGSVLSALDKLAFGIDPTSGALKTANPGTDGYEHTVGLIAEANKVVYGDESNTSSYPGIAAAGANININGPIVRRVQVSLAVRAKTGIDIDDISDKIKSAVASYINQTPVGTPIALSEIVSVAQAVNGVVAITILSPFYGTGSDLINIQPFEKPLVLDTEQDIQVSFVE